MPSRYPVGYAVQVCRARHGRPDRLAVASGKPAQRHTGAVC
ncbi:MAG TPA: hypothetical protein PKA99_04955 [Dermatophilaceae bacterium]|nr:hypothetical protein [Dermatophilaceae bacterium]